MNATFMLRALTVAIGLLVLVKGSQLVAVMPTLHVAAPAIASAAEPAASPAAQQPPPAAPAAAAAPEALAAALRTRREALDTREAALATREAVLAATERRLAARIDELAALQSRIERAESEAREREEGHWRGIARLYEIMRPREAAAVLNELDLPVMAQVVDRMGERKAAPILGAMQPERVRQLTLELARLRAARPPS